MRHADTVQKGFIRFIPLLGLVLLVVATIIAVKQVQRKQETRTGAQSTGVSLYVQPASQSFGFDTQFSVQIRENSNAQPVQAVQVNLGYPTNLLDVVSIDSAGTAFGVQAEQLSSNGLITISRGTTSAVTQDQLIATVTFRTKQTGGQAQVSFVNGLASPGSQNGNAVVSGISPYPNILTDMIGGTYNVNGPTATPTPTPTSAPYTQASYYSEASYYSQATYQGSYATSTPTSTPTPTPTALAYAQASYYSQGYYQATYEGSYYSQGYYQGSYSGGGGGGSPACTAQAPTGAPNLFRIDTTSNSAVLYFGPAGDPVSYYYITYGFSSGDDRFGTSFNSGHSDGVLQATIGQLGVNTTYYFKVRAGNGCATGGWSQTIQTKTSPATTTTKSSFTKTQPSKVTTTTNNTFNSLKPKTTPSTVAQNIKSPLLNPNASPVALSPVPTVSPTVQPLFTAPTATPVPEETPKPGFFARIGQFFVNLIRSIFHL